ncbi:MAG: methylated-DNA--[protein]-cysteine S-methyltransferase [Geodermatophilaceae bacterium]|nr:methylated-DNA--[protein]-cysteine S-methyltransferase [Geodermatophilaceae bacterium]
MSATEDLLTALPSDPAAERRLRDRLVAEAERTGLLDVAYRNIDSPVGPLLLAASEAGLLKVAFAAVEDRDQVLASLAARISPRLLHAPARLDGAARELGEYFAGHRTAFELPLDLRLAHGFRRTVLDHLRRVDYGSTTTYAALAAQAGSPRAVRATGSACATNPLPLVVPCHRVLRSDGTVGQYAGGAEVKQALLRLESSTMVT